MTELTREKIMAKWNGMTSSERDAWVAEVAFRWKPLVDGRMRSSDGFMIRAIPEYTTDICAAWEVVELFESKGYLFSLKNLVGGNYEFTLTDWGGKCDIYSAQGDTPQEAICKAALYAVTHYAEINLPNQREDET